MNTLRLAILFLAALLPANPPEGLLPADAEVNHLHARSPALDIPLKNADASNGRLADYRGRKVLAIFWASW